jgi:hypothetical protein
MKVSRKRKYRENVRQRKDAWRIAIFLSAVGIRPDIQGESWRACLNGLCKQYSALPNAVKAEARRQGRSRIRAAGLEELGSAIVAPHPKKPRKPVPALGPLARPKCGACRSQWGPKALWPTQEEADRFIVRNGDSGRMLSYRCPISGFHVGRLPTHLRSAPTIPILPESPSLPC